MTHPRLAASLWVLLLIAAGPSPAADLFVSPAGNDAWTGRRPGGETPAPAAKRDATAPQKDEAPADRPVDGPLASLEAAVKASRRDADAARRIVLGPGRYYLQQPLVLEAADSGLSIEGAGPGKTILYGGRRIDGWKKDGDRFWVADVPETRQGTWDFRALVVNDRLCPRARLPEKGRLEHQTRFPVRWMSTAGGGWERKPTPQELTTMQYAPGDLGEWLSVRNAEVTIYHMWDESMVGIAKHDAPSRTLTFSTPAKSPPGAFGVNSYVVWNVREGMTQPGQWYLDRDQGRIVYWPLPDESMAEAVAVAPRVETILELRGQKQKPLRRVALRNLTLSATTTPCKAGGFGASAYRGAVQATWTEELHLAHVEITNTAGHALCDHGSRELRIEQCELHHLGAGALGLSEGSGRIENNRLHHVGLLYPSAIGVRAGSRSGTYTIRRNEIHHTPYSGMSVGGSGAVIEENLLHHCMQELHDGAAIYMGGGTGHVVRRNVARDIVKIGQGYGVSSYYLDEKCRDCIVEKNVSIGVERPSHNHMTIGCTLRDNVFLSEGDMDLSFARSADFRVTGNTLQLNGKLKIGDPDAVTQWSGNVIVQAGDVRPAISDAMPAATVQPRTTPRQANVVWLETPPVLDGKLDGGEWPSGGLDLSETPQQRRGRGAPLMAKLCADRQHLYVALAVVSMYPEDRKLGRTWGTDEGVELALEGRRPDGTAVVYLLRGYTSGSPESLTLAGATDAEAGQLAAKVGYAAAVDKQVWRCEWRIPWEALRVTPRPGAALPMNVTVYRSENKQCIQWAGTLGETWDLARGGRLLFPAAKPSRP